MRTLALGLAFILIPAFAHARDRRGAEADCLERGGPADYCACLETEFDQRTTDAQYDHWRAFQRYVAAHPLEDPESPRSQKAFAAAVGMPLVDAYSLRFRAGQLFREALEVCDEQMAANEPPPVPLSVAEYPTAIVGEWRHEKTLSRFGDKPASNWSMRYRDDGTYAECRSVDARLPLACADGSYFVQGSSLRKEGLKAVRIVVLAEDHLVLSLGNTDRYHFRRVR